MRKMLTELRDGLRSLAAEAVNPEAWYFAVLAAFALCIAILMTR